MQDTTPQPTKSRNHLVSGTLIATVVVFVLAAGAGLLWSKRTMEVPLTAAAAFSCPGGQETVVPISMSEKAKRRADIITNNTYGEGGVAAITSVLVQLRPSSDLAKDGYAVTGGQLLVGDNAVGNFTVDDPGVARAIRLNPSAANPPPNAQLRLCLQRP